MKFLKSLFFMSFLVFSLSSFASAGGFQVYPGAEFREDLKGMASGPIVTGLMKPEGTRTKVFTTSDRFEKVVAFYRGIGKQYRVGALERRRGKKLYELGYKLEEAFFILDGARDIWSSKLWVRVQSPLIGEVEGQELDRKYEDIETTVTGIMLVDKREPIP